MNDVEMDLRPEYCRYRDEGCELASSCLNCPFSRCIYDQPGGRQHWLKKARDREIARQFATGNKRVKELALGRKLAVIFFDEHNPKEAVVAAVYV